MRIGIEISYSLKLIVLPLYIVCVETKSGEDMDPMTVSHGAAADDVRVAPIWRASVSCPTERLSLAER